MNKSIDRIRLISLFTYICSLFCSSCTSMLMQEGERPWALRGELKSKVDSTYGPPTVSGRRFSELDTKILKKTNSYSSCTSYTRFGVYDIRGPFPEHDTTKSLEALYYSVFTFGAAELIMLPPTIIDRTYHMTQTKPFLFLFDRNDRALCVTPASANILNVIQSHNATKANTTSHPKK